uniref:Uncharacterized protein n=1 Tax=Arundo donax TaxID=35708 RepID=A0A0A8ZIR1_ARUDO
MSQPMASMAATPLPGSGTRSRTTIDDEEGRPASGGGDGVAVSYRCSSSGHEWWHRRHRGASSAVDVAQHLRGHLIERVT